MLDEAPERKLSELVRAARDAGTEAQEIEEALDDADPRGALLRLLSLPTPHDSVEPCSSPIDEVSSPPPKHHVPSRVEDPQLVVQLRHAAAQLQHLVMQLRLQAEVLTPVAAERCRRVATLCAEECVRLARYSKEASISSARHAHRILEAFLQQARRRISDVLREANERLLRSEALQLRSVEGLAWPGTYFSDSPFLFQLQWLPRCALVAAAFLSLRVATALNAVIDTAIHELLHGRTAIAKLGLIASLASGSSMLYLYRQDLLSDISASSVEDRSAHIQLAKNLQRMPPLFWCVSCASGAVALEASRELCLSIVRRVLRMSIRSAVIASVLTGAVCRGSIYDNLEGVGPRAVAVMNTSWYECQVFTRLAFAKLCPSRPRPPRSAVEPLRKASPECSPEKEIGRQELSREPAAANIRTGDERVEAETSRNGPFFQGSEQA